MEPDIARRLVAAEGRAALAVAELPDPDSLAAATRLRRDVDPGLAAATLSQVALRRRAVAKFGAAAHELFLTPDGLEQATRPDVARWRAQRLVAAGVRRVLDLGCGLGTDAAALAMAGIDVVAVERDETTAVLAAANLARLPSGAAPAAVLHADATTIDPGDRTVFCDPARRTGAGRSWRVADFSPPWDFVTGLLDRPAGACLKLGPGVPHRLLPPDTRTEWISHRGEAVEACVWSHHLAAPGRAAVLLPGEHTLQAGDHPTEGAPVGEIGAYVHEPDPAVLAAGALAELAAATGAWRVHTEIAYLSTDEPVSSPFWTSFAIVDRLPWREKDLRRWVRDHGIGTLEIKKRGIEVDPAALRRRLKPAGPNRALIAITPTTGAAAVLVLRRTPPHPQGAD